MLSEVNLIITGGSGHWAESNHYEAILNAKRKGINVFVAAIVDINNPYKNVTPESNLSKILNLDSPEWICPQEKTINTFSLLDNFLTIKKCQGIIISSNPDSHFDYCLWAFQNSINILCDKPLIVVPNASSSFSSAKKIESQYLTLLELFDNAKRENPSFMFCVPLRRRVLTPFVEVAKSLKYINDQFQQGIRYMNVIVNGGLHRFPNEFLNRGAHGYINGYGALSHSSYHYIDIIAWYLKLAIGKIYKIRITLAYVSRVRDYLGAYSFDNLRKIISPSIQQRVNLPQNILDSELDFTFHLSLYDSSNNRIGVITYTSNHTTYTPRLTPYNEIIEDPANELDGGRMSQFIIDIHQGALSNWVITKNDIVFKDYSIKTVNRLHPNIGSELQIKVYEDAYIKDTVTPVDLTEDFILNTYLVCKTHSNSFDVPTLLELKLTNKLFSSFYELISQEVSNSMNNYKCIEIKICDYL